MLENGKLRVHLVAATGDIMSLINLTMTNGSWFTVKISILDKELVVAGKELLIYFCFVFYKFVLIKFKWYI